MNANENHARVLVVEDELPMRIALEDCLKRAGYRVISAQQGEQGLQRALDESPDLILLDVMLPKLDGFGVCRALRNAGCRSAILMLTAKGQWEDRVKGLDEGADDYVVKPFQSEELLARVRALLRRQDRSRPALTTLVLGEVEIDFIRQTARRKKRAVLLTAKEFGMLRLMAEADGEPITRERFLDVVWGYAAFPTTRTVDMHIASLRNKLERNSESPQWIRTVHGVGYRLEIPREAGVKAGAS